MALRLPPGDELAKPISYYLMQMGLGTTSEASTRMTAKKTTADEEDDIDLFGDEDPKAAEEAKKLAEKKKAEAQASKKKKIEKSLLLIDCKPFSTETDLDTLASLVKAIKMDGLEWKEQTKKIPMAFGLHKLQVGCVVQDDLVSTDELCEKIENVGMTEEQMAKRKAIDEGEEEGDEDEELGLVQSCEIVSFNKL